MENKILLNVAAAGAGVVTGAILGFAATRRYGEYVQAGEGENDLAIFAGGFLGVPILGAFTNAITNSTFESPIVAFVTGEEIGLLAGATIAAFARRRQR